MTILGPTPDLSQGPLDLSRPAWYADAACRGEPTALFFPTDRPSQPQPEVDRIRALCGSCPVVAECAEAGRREKWGWWGGQSEKARATAARRLRTGYKGPHHGAAVEAAEGPNGVVAHDRP